MASATAASASSRCTASVCTRAASTGAASDASTAARALQASTRTASLLSSRRFSSSCAAGGTCNQSAQSTGLPQLIRPALLCTHRGQVMCLHMQSLDGPHRLVLHLIRHGGQEGIEGRKRRAGMQPGGLKVVVLHALEQQGQDASTLQCTAWLQPMREACCARQDSRKLHNMTLQHPCRGLQRMTCPKQPSSVSMTMPVRQRDHAAGQCCAQSGGRHSTCRRASRSPCVSTPCVKTPARSWMHMARMVAAGLPERHTRQGSRMCSARWAAMLGARPHGGGGLHGSEIRILGLW